MIGLTGRGVFLLSFQDRVLLKGDLGHLFERGQATDKAHKGGKVDIFQLFMCIARKAQIKMALQYLQHLTSYDFRDTQKR